MDLEIIAADAGAVDGLKTLWLQMLSYHRNLVGGEVPVHSDEQSWARTRRVYCDWLENDTAILVIARSQTSSEPLGYAVCRLVAGGGRTFDLARFTVTSTRWSCMIMHGVRASAPRCLMRSETDLSTVASPSGRSGFSLTTSRL